MNKFLIIGGTTKAGTTSLFKYLSDHPEFCPARFKETRYFLNKNYQLQRTGKGDDYLENEYNKLFSCEDGLINLEATPDYLYSENTASFIKNTLSGADVKVVFLLRNPVDRFISWFKFAKQDGKIETNAAIKDYFEANIHADSQN